VLSLSSLGPTSGELPLTVAELADIPQFVVPPFTSRLDIAASSTVPIDFTTSPDFGSPELLSSRGTDAVVSQAASDIPASAWSCPPTELGTGPKPAAPFQCGADAEIKAFDPSVSSSTGNIWSALEGLTDTYDPLVLQPGESGDITVSIAPAGRRGAFVSGFLAVETFNFNTISSDQIAAVPYSYVVG
jgi:hypothetical protein